MNLDICNLFGRRDALPVHGAETRLLDEKLTIHKQRGEGYRSRVEDLVKNELTTALEGRALITSKGRDSAADLERL